jgi:glycerol-3-phosphate cytidylyltransferase-like family protein
MTAENLLLKSFEAVSQANKDLSEYLIVTAERSEAAIQAAVMAERERCAKIAEIEYMTPRDIARVIRSNYPSD